MKSFRNHIKEMSIRSYDGEDGRLEELKFGNVHLACMETKRGLSLNSTSNTMHLNKKEIAELVVALNKFL